MRTSAERRSHERQKTCGLRHNVPREPLNKSPTADDGSFPPILRFEKREIHTVFHRFSSLVLTKNLSPSTAADLIRASLELTAILAQNLPQMGEIHAIGKAVSQRPEKGAAVATAEFLQANFPDRAGFSPRNVRRMRDFYKVYENDQTLLQLAMKLGWTLNVVIMEAELTSDVRKWYLEQAQRRGWTKAELQAALEAEAYDVQREETEIMKPIKVQIARKLHMLKTRFLFNVAGICEKRLTSKSSPGRSEDLRYSDACLDGRCSIVYLLFLIFSATTHNRGVE